MAAAQGGVYSKGKLRYQVERTPWNVGKALLFGRSALDETEEYYAEKLKTFSEKQTAAWEKMQEAGEPARTVEEQRQRAKEGYDLIRQLSSIEKENDDDNRAALQRQALRERRHGRGGQCPDGHEGPQEGQPEAGDHHEQFPDG